MTPQLQRIQRKLGKRVRVARELAAGLRWPPFAPDLPLDELKARYQLPTSRYVRIAGVDAHVVEEGQGPPLVLLHGLMASLHTWDGWAEALADRFRVIRVDLPGFGLTGPDPLRRYHGTDLVAFLEALRSALDVGENMYLAGSSLGGFLAWNYAVTYPERVRRMVLLDPLAYTLEPLPFIRALGSPAGRWLGARVDPRRSVELGVYDVFGDASNVSPQAIRRYQDLAMRPGNRAALSDYCAMLMELLHHNPYERQVAKLSVPTLLMWGSRDRWIPVSQVERWRADVADLHVQLYEGVGHVPMEESPAQTAADASAFLLSP